MGRYNTSGEFEGMISRALLADASTPEGQATRAKQLARVGCKTAAMQAMFCPVCSGILDQTRTVVFQVKNDTTGRHGKMMDCCSKCWASEIRPAALETLSRTENHTYVAVDTWDGPVTLRKGGDDE